MVFSVGLKLNGLGIFALPKAAAPPPPPPKVPPPPAAGELTIGSATVRDPGKFTYGWAMYHGPAYPTKIVKGKEVPAPKYTDVHQQDLNDCPVCADIAAMARMRPEEMAMVQDVTPIVKGVRSTEGKYTVKFGDGTVVPVSGWLPTYEADPATPGQRPALLYGGGAAAHQQKPGTMTMFFPIIQKAYAQFLGPKTKPSYDALDNGIDPVKPWKDWKGWQTFETPSDNAHWLKNLPADLVWNRIDYSVTRRAPATLTTYGKSKDYNKTEDNTLIGDHTNAIIDRKEFTDKATGIKTRWVKMYNPWGSVAPTGKDPDGTPNNDATGVFWLPLQPLTDAEKKIYPDAPTVSVTVDYQGFQVGFPPDAEPKTAAEKKLFSPSAD